MWLYNLYHPEVFQGRLSLKNYFEGWYLKHVNVECDAIFAFIPGVSLGKNAHAFIQMIDGISGKTDYVTFPIEEFRWDRKKFAVTLGGCYFSAKHSYIDLNINNQSIRGEIHYSGQLAYPKSLLNPGIMGWYSFVPTMECKHAVVSLNHSLEGALTIGKRKIDFTVGRGYIEKDWGTSFPAAYFWLQCNNFSDPDVSMMLSIAKIPWRRHFFIGFLGFLYWQGKYYSFASYNQSRIVRFQNNESQKVVVTILNAQNCLELEVRLSRPGSLKAPRQGEMNGVIKECINAEVDLVFQVNKQRLFVGTGRAAGCELHGDLSGYFKGD